METHKDIHRGRVWNRYFILLVLSSTFISVALQLTSAAYPLYIDFLGASASFTGVTMMAGTIAAIVTRFVVGRLADTKGRRNLMLLGTFIFGAATLLLRFIPNLWAVVLFRMLQFVGFSTITNTSSTAVADVIPAERMGEGIGYYGLGNTLATALGPSLALAIIAGNNYGNVFSASFLAVILAGVMLVFCSYERYMAVGEPIHKQKLKTDAKGVWKYLEPAAIPPAVVQLVINVGMSVFISFLLLYANKSGIKNAGLFFTVAAASMLISRLAVGKIADRFGVLVVLIPAYTLTLVACLVLAFTTNQVLYFAMGVLYGFGMGSGMPVLNAIVMKNAPANRRGVASTTYFLSMDIGFGGGGLLWGVVIDTLGFTAMFIGAAFFILLGMVLSIIFFGPKKPREGAKAYAETTVS